jgi:hypothetical protein
VKQSSHVAMTVAPHGQSESRFGSCFVLLLGWSWQHGFTIHFAKYI